MTVSLRNVVPIALKQEAKALDEFPKRHEEFAQRYIAALLDFPEDARTSLVPADVCVTHAQKSVYEAIQATCLLGRAPTIEAIGNYFRQKELEPELLIEFMGRNSPSSPIALMPEALDMVALFRAHSALRGLAKDFTLMRPGDVRLKLEQASSAFALLGGVTAHSSIDMVEIGLRSLLINKSGIKSGWDSVDEIMQMEPGDLVVIAAETGIGKSSVMLSWMAHLADQNIPCAMISGEDSHSVMARRWISIKAGIEQDMWRKNEFTLDDKAKLSRVKWDVPASFFYDTEFEAEPVVRTIRSCAASGAKVVFLDYFQQLTTEEKTSTETAAYNRILRLISRATKSTNIITVIASQVTRPGKLKEGEVFEPKLSNLAGTSALEKSAQGVVMLWGRGDGFISGKVAKAKNGMRSQQPFALIRNEYQRVVETSRPSWQAPKREPLPEGYDD